MLGACSFQLVQNMMLREERLVSSERRELRDKVHPNAMFWVKNLQSTGLVVKKENEMSIFSMIFIFFNIICIKIVNNYTKKK